jgi:isopenicillin-N epimerase
MSTRRTFLRDASLLGAASLTLAPARAAAAWNRPQTPPGSAADRARDEAFWAWIAAQYRVSSDVTNLEGVSFGMIAVPVLDAFHRNADRANDGGSYFARREFGRILYGARSRIAAFVGAKPSELMVSSSATEALRAIIVHYNRVGPGDTVMYADLDFNAMQWAMHELAARRGATVARLDIPEPATHDSIVESYKRALDAHPRTKLLLLTHCNNKTGLLLPVRDIVALARPRGVDVVVDAAHSFGQVPLTVAELDAEFVGFNLHKWVGAPLGVGAMYIREDKMGSVDPAQGPEAVPGALIDARLQTGALNLATIMTVPHALDFQASIGIENKAARLRYLRDRWVNAVRGIDGVDVLTPDDAHLVGAISSFRLHGRGDAASNQAITKSLLDEFGVFTFARTGLAKGDCVRVTPALYNSAADVDKLARALTKIVARG